ncbi:hypothetical protein GCM10023187_53400 [Nibrella viscosa]|uniref:Uncharacterized protein n=1 Tax=Nibrella viscosa TaxID=1084524 RepID=A0ABP8KYI2_9BACT
MAKKAQRRRADVTRRVLVRATSAAVRQASQKAMEVSGYIIQAQDGWVVRLDRDGQETRLAPINRVERPAQLILD